MTVVLDSREPSHIKELFHEYYPEGKVELLESGDLVCPKYSVAIERKVNTDYIGSIMGTKEEEGRLWFQAERMQETYQHNYIILVGGYDDLPTEDKERFSREMWNGSMISLMARNNIKFFEVKTNREFFQISKKIFSKSDGIKPNRCNLKKVTKNDSIVSVGCLYQIPNLGITQSKAIVDHFNIRHARELVNLTVEDLLSVPKIGKVKAQAIKEEF